MLVWLQPVIMPADKQRISEFVGQAPTDLQDLGATDFIHLDRSRAAYWRTGIDELLKSVDDLIATPPQPQQPMPGIQAPAPAPDGEPQPEPQASATAAALDQRVAATESQAELRRVKSTPHPEPEGSEPEGEPVDEAHPFRCCLDRPYVQKEIRWAQKYGKVRDTPTVPVLSQRASEGGREGD